MKREKAIGNFTAAVANAIDTILKEKLPPEEAGDLLIPMASAIGKMCTPDEIAAIFATACVLVTSEEQ